MYYAKLTKTCYSTCVLLLLLILIASIVLICKSLWIKVSTKCKKCFGSSSQTFFPSSFCFQILSTKQTSVALIRLKLWARSCNVMEVENKEVTESSLPNGSTHPPKRGRGRPRGSLNKKFTTEKAPTHNARPSKKVDYFSPEIVIKTKVKKRGRPKKIKMPGRPRKIRAHARGRIRETSQVEFTTQAETVKAARKTTHSSYCRRSQGKKRKRKTTQVRH